MPRFKGERAYRHIGVTMIVTVLAVMPITLVTALAVEMGREFGDSSAGAIGLVATAFFGSTAAASLAIASRMDQLGGTRGIALSASIVVVSLLGASTAITWGQAGIWVALGGIGNAVGQPAGNLYLMRHLAPARMGFGLAAKHAGLPISGILAGLAIPLIVLPVGWRWTLRLVPLAILLALILVKPSGESEAGGGTYKRPSGKVASGRRLALIALVGGLAGGSGNALGAFTVPAVVDTGVALATAGLILSAGHLIGLGVRMALGVSIDRYRRVGQMPTVGWILFASTVGYVLLANATSDTIAVAVLVAFGTGWIWPGLYTYVVVSENPTSPGAATAFGTTGATLGGLVIPLMFGAIVDTSGFSTAWFTLAGVAVLAGTVALLLGDRRPSPVT